MGFSKREPPPAWATAIAQWGEALRAEGATESTTRLRQTHMRSVAYLSRTTRPGQLTADALSHLHATQGWQRGYSADLRTSVQSFYDWAVNAGLVDDNPAREYLAILKHHPRTQKRAPSLSRGHL